MNSLRKELVSVRIPEALNKRLAKHVSLMGISKTAFILSLINKELRDSDTPISNKSIDNNTEPAKTAV